MPINFERCPICGKFMTLSEDSNSNEDVKPWIAMVEGEGMGKQLFKLTLNWYCNQNEHDVHLVKSYPL